MRGPFVYILILLLWTVPSWASHPDKTLEQEVATLVDPDPKATFLNRIPAVAEQFIGMPFKLGGRPASTGTTDNSSLFYAIYATAAQDAGLNYNRAYLPMRYLLENMVPVPEEEVRNGDLIVLDNNLAAMVYRVEFSGRMHFIYASKKRQQVISFNSGNLVYQVYWLEHLKGFYRLKNDMLQPGR